MSVYVSDQRRAALDYANQIRTRRARLKRDLKAGRATVSEVLLEPPAFMESARVLEVLLAAPRVGRVKASAVLNQARVSPTKTLGHMTARQRAEVARRLP